MKHSVSKEFHSFMMCTSSVVTQFEIMSFKITCIKSKLKFSFLRLPVAFMLGG